MGYQVLSDMSKALILEQESKCTLSGLCIYRTVNIYFTLEAQLFKYDRVYKLSVSQRQISISRNKYSEKCDHGEVSARRYFALTRVGLA